MDVNKQCGDWVDLLTPHHAITASSSGMQDTYTNQHGLSPKLASTSLAILWQAGAGIVSDGDVEWMMQQLAGVVGEEEG